MPVFRNAEGFLHARFVIPLAVAAALSLMAVLGLERQRRAFAAWLSLAFLGQAVSLQLVRAGPSVNYQHYAPWSQLLAPEQRLWSALLGVQLVLVAAGLLRAWRNRKAAQNRWNVWQVLAVVLLTLLTSAAASREVVRYGGELLLASLIQLLHLGTVTLAVMAAPAGWLAAAEPRIEKWLGPASASHGEGFWRIDRFVLIAAAWTLLATAALCILAYQRHPHVPDEVVYLLHAKYFAQGLLEMPPPLVREAFDLDLMTYEATRWYSPVPPGWPAVLAVGARLGVPWLVNPLLSGMSVILAYVLLRDVYGTRTARLATVFLCTSPWFLFLGMSLMSHQLTLCAALAGSVAVAWLRRGASPLWATPAGIAIGTLAIIRPLEGFIAAVLLGFWALGGQARMTARWVAVGLMAVISIATAAITLPYNAHFTGRPTYFPIMAYTDAAYGPGSNALGFGPDRGLPFGGLDPFPGHGLGDVVVNAILNLFQVNIELLGWGTGSILLLAILVTSRAWKRQDVWMAIAMLAVIGAHSFYWFSGGPDFGARYWYLILIPALALTARGLQVAAGHFARPDAGTRVYAAALCFCIISLVVFTPWRATDKYFHYRSMRPDVRELVRSHDFGRSLILVGGQRMPDYMSAAPYNPVGLQGDAPVFAWDVSPEVRRRVLEAYRDRPVWLVAGPSETGSGFRVVAGPLSAEQLLREAPRGP
jgi:hypothetical protein